MKVSVSLPNEDVRFLDRYAASQGIGSRSAAVHKAVRLLRASELGPAYENAWAVWAESTDADAWESSISDGLS
ncbi:MAG: ribbon-helix-helix domain-containing protein [Pseudonocardiaceae bacterium]